MSAHTIRNFIGKVKVVEGSMNRGYVLVVEDKRLGDYPLASINLPFKKQTENKAVAEYLAEAWNEAILNKPKS